MPDETTRPPAAVGDGSAQRARRALEGGGNRCHTAGDTGRGGIERPPQIADRRRSHNPGSRNLRALVANTRLWQTASCHRVGTADPLYRLGYLPSHFSRRPNARLSTRRLDVRRTGGSLRPDAPRRRAREVDRRWSTQDDPVLLPRRFANRLQRSHAVDPRRIGAGRRVTRVADQRLGADLGGC